MNKEELVSYICEHNADTVLLQQLSEELSEATHAALKLSRKLEGKNPTPKTLEQCLSAFQEEVADVLLCLEVCKMRGLYSCDIVEHTVMSKLKRWKERLEAING